MKKTSKLISIIILNIIFIDFLAAAQREKVVYTPKGFISEVTKKMPNYRKELINFYSQLKTEDRINLFYCITTKKDYYENKSRATYYANIKDKMAESKYYTDLMRSEEKKSDEIKKFVDENCNKLSKQSQEALIKIDEFIKEKFPYQLVIIDEKDIDWWNEDEYMRILYNQLDRYIF